eukprot:4770783-Prymnesium_polylepis.1
MGRAGAAAGGRVQRWCRRNVARDGTTRRQGAAGRSGGVLGRCAQGAGAPSARRRAADAGAVTHSRDGGADHGGGARAG